MRKRRTLTADEKELWQRVVRDVQPLFHTETTLLVATTPAKKPAPLVLTVVVPVKQARVLSHASSQKSQLPPVLEPCNRIGIDRRTAQRFERGKMALNGRLDLHGLNRESARVSLHHFLLQHAAWGNRCLLVITGKGSKGESILRQSLPLWLNEPTLRPLILSYSSAHAKDGGEGAFYILLKKRHKNSKL